MGAAGEHLGVGQDLHGQVSGIVQQAEGKTLTQTYGTGSSSPAIGV
ncbi:hypothetical protein [Streptomyces melanogenes]|nr:hypothetical protein [Streptomyces melanogenes]